jgi:hypothetical protein
MYQFKEEFNHNQFFWWDKKLIENLNWALLPTSSKTVFPVIACHANNKGEAFPGEQTIAIIAGISDKIVREGIRGLEAFPNFRYDYYLSRRGKRSKRFFINIPSNNNRGSAFPFYKFILEAGIWREMRPTAKALYPVLRHFGFFDINLYSEIEDLEFCEADMEEVFPYREYDFCDADLGILAEFAGIHRNSIKAALDDLERNFLIQPLVVYSGWKVFLRSKDNTIWKRDYLNKKILSSYRHIIQCTKTTGNDAQNLPKNAQTGSVR